MVIDEPPGGQSPVIQAGRVLGLGGGGLLWASFHADFTGAALTSLASRRDRKSPTKSEKSGDQHGNLAPRAQRRCPGTPRNLILTRKTEKTECRLLSESAAIYNK